jgi:Rrf2 family protein
MKIGRSTGYALLAMAYIAQDKSKKTLSSRDVSKQYDLPLEYLLKILQQLVKANLLYSKRGPSGGFTLAKQADKITVLQIIEAVEGPVANPLSLAELAPNAKISARADKVFAQAEAQAKAVYSQTKLSSIITK